MWVYCSFTILIVQQSSLQPDHIRRNKKDGIYRFLLGCTRYPSLFHALPGNPWNSRNSLDKTCRNLVRGEILMFCKLLLEVIKYLKTVCLSSQCKSGESPTASPTILKFQLDISFLQTKIMSFDPNNGLLCLKYSLNILLIRFLLTAFDETFLLTI